MQHTTVIRQRQTKVSSLTFRNQSGFSLIELMVVIVILAVLAALIVPNVLGKSQQAKVKTTRISLQSIETELGAFKLDNNRYPTTAEGLDALVTAPAGAVDFPAGGYIKKKPKDSWKQDFQYSSNGKKFTVYSVGADGEDGTEDDVTLTDE